MHADRFDRLSRLLTTRPSRRTALSLGCGALLGALGLDTAEARKHKKKRKKKGSGTTPGPGGGPKEPGCTDGVRNGAEVDIDCGGGTCPRCVNGKNCVRRADCASAFCSQFGACVACAADAECGSGCFCWATSPGAPMNCYSRTSPGGPASGCASCPTGTVCLFGNTPGAACFPLCATP